VSSPVSHPQRGEKKKKNKEKRYTCVFCLKGKKKGASPGIFSIVCTHGRGREKFQRKRSCHFASPAKKKREMPLARAHLRPRGREVSLKGTPPAWDRKRGKGSLVPRPEKKKFNNQREGDVAPEPRSRAEREGRRPGPLFPYQLYRGRKNRKNPGKKRAGATCP